MKPQRLELALEHIQPTQWRRFETFASEFLTAEFANLRTMASQSGDRGRDAELFSPPDDPSVVLQYSVAKDWSDKILKTVKRIRAEFPDVTILVYVTNQAIGADGDEIRKSVRRNHGLMLDIRDRSWFLDRLHSGPQREAAAEGLAQDIVDPYLASREIITRKPTALTSTEAQAACVYLALQWEDDTREKGLTKLCFDALVRAVLRDTTSENRMTREDVRRRVREVLPTHPPNNVDLYTDSSLGRLTKRYIRHWVSRDEFCLMHEERLRLRDRLAAHESADLAFRKELSNVLQLHAARLGIELGVSSSVHERVCRVLEKFMLGRGEAFASAVRTGDYRQIGFDELNGIAIRDISDVCDSEHVGPDLADLVVATIEDLVQFPNDATQTYLRSLHDAYTLLAFLRETPDVQSAIIKMFSDGEIWLDTSIVLPLFAESLLEHENRRYTNLFRAATEAGLQLLITPGVLEEIERHMNLCTAYHRDSRQWRGHIPFLYSLYTLSGRALGQFPNWIAQFRGENRPEDDIAEYLQSLFGVTVADLEPDLQKAPDDLRVAIDEIWQRIHSTRRASDPEFITTHRLASHDSENYVGVIQRRKSKGAASPFGYNSWWLTLDRNAHEVASELRGYLTTKAPDSPVMSPDFLVNYLAFGPVRARVSQGTESSLPLVIDYSLTEYLPKELVATAQSVREEMKDYPEHLIRRKVRDSLDAAKSRRGRIAIGGISAMMEDLEHRIKEKDGA